MYEDSAVDISDEIERLQKKSQQLTKEIYGKLTRGRSPRWPSPAAALHADIIAGVFTDFHELHGDRTPTTLVIVGGLIQRRAVYGRRPPKGPRH